MTEAPAVEHQELERELVPVGAVGIVRTHASEARHHKPGCEEQQHGDRGRVEADEAPPPESTIGGKSLRWIWMPVRQNQAGQDEEPVDTEIAPADQAAEARELQVQICVVGEDPKREQTTNRSQIG